MMFTKLIIIFFAENVRLVAALPIVVVSRRVGCFGDRAHDFVSHRKGPVKCSNCGETAANVKQMKGKLSFACPGPSKCEPSVFARHPCQT